MKHGLLQLLRMIEVAAVTALAFGAGVASADTTAAGPYYATPSWDQTLPASTRFVVLSNFSNQAVLDRETGLVWERSPDATQAPWPVALFICLNKNVGGRGGWKLPNIQELRSLVDPTKLNPALPVGHPFTNLQSSSYYWSATTEVTDTLIGSVGNQARAMSLFTGSVDNPSQAKTQLLYVWCVRGGPGSDAQ
jgi:hypothetical protein